MTFKHALMSASMTHSSEQLANWCISAMASWALFSQADTHRREG